MVVMAASMVAYAANKPVKIKNAFKKNKNRNQQLMFYLDEFRLRSSRRCEVPFLFISVHLLSKYMGFIFFAGAHISGKPLVVTPLLPSSLSDSMTSNKNEKNKGNSKLLR